MITETSNLELIVPAADLERKPDPGALDVLAATFEALPDALYLFDHGKRLSRFNRAAIALQGAQDVAFEGRRCCEMFWGVDAGEECVVDRAVASGTRVEIEMLAGALADQPTLLIVQPMREAMGSAVVIARDISQLRRAEAEAFEHKSFMASVADRTPDDIYTVDAEGRITWMNERAEQDQLLMLAGRSFNEFIAAESRELTTRNLQRTLVGEETQFEVRAIRTDGTVRHFEAHTSPLWKDGNVTGALVFLRDITERKLSQDLMAQSDKLRAVGELAAGVAHNLNNSLTVIKGRAQLLLMRSTDEAVSKSLKVITSAVEDGSVTLRRILEFARRESFKEFAPVELGELIASSLEIARPKWQNKATSVGTGIKVLVEKHDPVYVLGEASELREVVLNLIFNAVDAMTEGGTMEVGSRAEIESGCFWVADSGCGMNPETVARIFEPFYTTKGQKGTGLGLSASHGIISRHGGEIMVVSEPGEGTRFEIRLPLCADDTRFVQPIQAAQADRKPVPAARVLIVEDEEQVSNLLAEAFESSGHSVTSVKLGADAISFMMANECDLVVTDLGLPDVSGLHISRWIKQHRPKMPCLLATGWAELVTPEDHQKGRIDAVFQKPYTPSEIVARAEQVLGLSSLPADQEVAVPG
jgi:PAS domain S-box-containing protein